MDFVYNDDSSTSPPPANEDALTHSSGPDHHHTRPTRHTDRGTDQDPTSSYSRTEHRTQLRPESAQTVQLRGLERAERLLALLVSGPRTAESELESDDSDDSDDLGYGLPAPARKSRRMAIDHFPYPETHDLARPEKAFYPVTIPVSHWQLRHYISAPEPDHLYYASAHHIFCLNTATKKRKHIATLPFEARCTASGYGYVCVGGEDDGHFAAIKLNGAVDVDSALPINGLGQSVTRRAPTVKVERIGEEIVNSISIHRIQDEEAHLDDIVAVLTNNDRTVRIYSLPTGHETKCKDIPFAVNHATISPDGQLLVAVGDYNQAYFYKRVILEGPPQIPKPHNRLTSASVDWKRMCKVTLHVSAPETTVGYFTTAWSANASLVAAGSEGGYITIIDRVILEDDELDEENRDKAVVAVVPGSRADHPSPHPGAIRSMVFSPDPWDLLIWSEDQGRVCVGDLRTGLKSRQIIDLEPKHGGMERYEMDIVDPEDVVVPAATQPMHLDDLEAELLRGYRAAPDSESAVNFATEYIEARRRQREHRQALGAARQQVTQASARARVAAVAEALSGDPQGLTLREEQILDTLRATRQREEARSNGQLPRSVNYTTPDMFTGPARSGRDSPSSESTSRPISEILSSVQDNMPTLERIHATTSRPTSYTPDTEDTVPPLATMREALAAWSSGGDVPHLPRATSLRSADRTRVAAGLSEGEPSRGSRIRQSESNNEGDAWTAIEEQLGRGPLFEGSARANAASPLPAERDPAERDREVERDARREHWQSLQDVDLQRRIAASAARNRERWRSSRLVGSGVSSAAAERAISMAEARRSAAYPEQYEALIRRRQLRNWGSTTGREIGVRTAGLAISPDGRRLWAGCEEGIFEIDIKTKARMFMPSLDPR